MAAVGRESRFMPTVKCSTCGLQVEISLMGDHVCDGAPAAEPTPPLPAVSLFGRLLPAFGNATAPKPEQQQPRVPPQVDTSAANRAYIGQGQLTPISLSSGSQATASPKTPNARPGAGKADEYFSPQIVNNSPPPSRPRRPGGYGGLEDGNGYEDSTSPANPPKKQAPNLVERINNITPGPLDSTRRPSAAGRGGLGEANDRPGTSAYNLSSGLGSGRGPKAPRQNGYGGFGPPSKGPGSFDEPPATPNRAETFPRPNDSFSPPQRTPSAPASSAASRPGALRPPRDLPDDQDGRAPLTSERARRPSRGPDTSRPPPPRTAVVRPRTPVVPTINLAAEFGIGNPYHASSESTASSNSSENSQPSQSSSRTSPPRSLASRSRRKPSDTSGFDNLMSDLQSSMSEMKKPKPPAILPLNLPGKDARDRPSPVTARPPRSGERGYDPRIDPAVQNPRYRRGRSPPPSPMVVSPPGDGLRVQDHPAILSPGLGRLPSPRWTSSPERADDPQPLRPQQIPRPAARERSQSRPPREGMAQSMRGNCKACGLPIKGKSISSADGSLLTGRYHKPCFVCSTCQKPFASSTFYVLDDKPYCELHYHKLNGSLCGSCGKGIEGQYLEDESAVKHHVGCFKCGECGMALRDGYFEVAGKAYCERDAWRLVQQPSSTTMTGNNAGGGGGLLRPGGGPGPSGRTPGLPGGPRGGPAYGGGRFGPRPRMEKRMTRLGMM